MDYADPQYGYRHTKQEHDANSNHALCYEDTSIMDSDIMQLTDDSQLQRSSHTGVLSPADSHGWEQHFAGALTAQIIPLDAASDQYNEQSPVAHRGAHQQVQQPQSHTSSHGWPGQHPSAHYGLAVGLRYDPPPQAFERPRFMPQPHSDHIPQDMSHGMAGPAPPPAYGTHTDSMFNAGPQVQTPMSPHSHQDWMAMAQHDGDVSPVTRRLPDPSPSYPTMDMQRSDGIRKKNGRIDIPQDRNVQTIDGMIERETDEEKLKELKQQKRLLRNREAALASRQRKKKHTEELEGKEKLWGQSMTEMNERYNMLEHHCRNLDGENGILRQQWQQAQHELQAMEEDRLSMKRKHEEEMSLLRKKLQYMEDAPTMSHDPSSTSYGEFNANIEDLTVGAHDWEHFLKIPDLPDALAELFTGEPKPMALRQATSLQLKNHLTGTGSRTAINSPDTSVDEVATPGLLCFLLLCGAFVASKPAGSNSAGVLAFPEEVRAAAPALLNSLLSDPGPPINPSNSKNPQVSLFTRRRSLPRTHPNGAQTRLDHLHDSLTSASSSQQADTAFSLSSSQFAAMANMPTSPLSDLGAAGIGADTKVDFRPNLADPISYMPEEASQNDAADVTNRSVLWAQIPSDIIEQFKNMVKDQDDANELLGRTPVMRQLSASQVQQPQ